MVKATLLGLELSAFASQRDQCLSGFRLASRLLLSIYLSFFHSAVSLIFLSTPFHFLSPLSVCFFIRLSHSIAVLWPLFICPPLVFPSRFFLSLHSTFHGSIICFLSTFTDLSFINPPSFSSVLISLLSLKFIDVSSISWLLPSTIHLSGCWFMPALGAHALIGSAVLVQAVKPCGGLCALTFQGINAMFIWTCFAAELSHLNPAAVYQPIPGL